MPQQRRSAARSSRLGTRWARARAGVVLAAALVVTLAACTSAPAPSAPSTSAAVVPGSTAPGTPAPVTTTPAAHPGVHPGAHPGVAPTRPNVVFVLTDDLSTNLIKYMPHVQALQQSGMTFTNYTVTDSLCCPSRASIFTGDFPHNTGVVGNTAPNGGFEQFTRMRDDHSTFATSMSAKGYRTGFIGKYLNDYQPTHPIGYYAPVLKGAYVPPGWDVWHGVDGGGYAGYNYAMADGHDIQYYGTAPQDFFTTVAQEKGVEFLRESAGSRTPFMLEVATFSPHKPYTAAPQDIGTFAGLRAPRTPAFGRKPKHPPLWLVRHAPLGPGAYETIDRTFEKRVESVQAVDRMIGALERTLVETGEAANTVFVFSSDNGFHLGEYTLRNGKQTAYDTDIRVPLVVSGPGIRPGTVNTDMTQNIDLRPTFDALAGATTPADVDGHSLLPLLLGETPRWRTLSGIEHTRDPYKKDDPDAQSGFDGVPPTYNALRGRGFLYVRYRDGDREYYDLRKDPYELNNLGYSLTLKYREDLDAMLHRLVTCKGTAECWAAGLPAAT